MITEKTRAEIEALIAERGLRDKVVSGFQRHPAGAYVVKIVAGQIADETWAAMDEEEFLVRQRDVLLALAEKRRLVDLVPGPDEAGGDEIH